MSNTPRTRIVQPDSLGSLDMTQFSRPSKPADSYIARIYPDDRIELLPAKISIDENDTITVAPRRTLAETSRLLREEAAQQAEEQG